MICVPVSYGELLDKLTILEIKSERIADEHKRANVTRELTLLRQVRDRHVLSSGELAELLAELKATNERLWEIEDALREMDRASDFSERFIHTARAVYQTNDKRANLKRAINQLLGSEIVEEKSYGAHPQQKPPRHASGD